MIDLTTSQILQMSASLFVGVILFLAVIRYDDRVSIGILILLLPIQFVDSRYGTSNMLMTYLVTFAFALKGRLRLAPMFVPIALLLFAYALSFSMSQPAARIHHVFYLIGFFSNILIFYLVYNFIRQTNNWQFVLKCLFLSNIVVIAACFLELTASDAALRLFGIDEWLIKAGRADKGRLVGPFSSTHTTADYLVSQTVLAGFYLVFGKERNFRILATSLIALNSAFLVATGDRGGFVGFVAGALAFFLLFHKHIGIARAIKLFSFGIFAFVAGSYVVTNYTTFGAMYDRLEDTEIKTGLVDARSRGFQNGMSYFETSPIVGLGPKLSVSNKSRQIADIPYRPYPHILPMHILGTLGIVGFMAWLIFFISIIIKLASARRSNGPSEMLNAVPTLGLLIIALFLAGELRIEFLRAVFLDYQNYMFVLFGWFIACADLLTRKNVSISPPASIDGLKIPEPS